MKKLDSDFSERWSTRSYDGSLLSTEEKNLLLGAARSAPSCFNEQPWFFICADEEEQQRDKFLDLLAPLNQPWAAKASMLCFLVARKHFIKNDNYNRHYAFDCGAAWALLALQAQKMRLSAHAMAGFDVDKAYEVFQVDKENYEIMAAIAVGRPTEEARNSEERTSRKELAEIAGPTLV